MSDNPNRLYADAYASKVLAQEPRPKGKKSKLQKSRVGSRSIDARPKPIDKHGNYEGTDVGFTSTSIQNPIPKKKSSTRRKKPINRHGNYEGTDVGFTAEFENQKYYFETTCAEPQLFMGGH